MRLFLRLLLDIGLEWGSVEVRDEPVAGKTVVWMLLCVAYNDQTERIGEPYRTLPMAVWLFGVALVAGQVVLDGFRFSDFSVFPFAAPDLHEDEVLSAAPHPLHLAEARFGKGASRPVVPLQGMQVDSI